MCRRPSRTCSNESSRTDKKTKDRPDSLPRGLCREYVHLDMNVTWEGSIVRICTWILYSVVIDQFGGSHWHHRSIDSVSVRNVLCVHCPILRHLSHITGSVIHHRSKIANFHWDHLRYAIIGGHVAPAVISWAAKVIPYHLLKSL